MPKITFILPVYKVEKYLARVKDALLSQTLTDFEAIFVDDGSPDASGAICDAFAKEDSRLRVIHKKNGGVASARNAALDIASGDYIFFLDPDDFIEPDTAETLVQAADRENADIVLFGRRNDVYDDNGTLLSSSVIHPPLVGTFRGEPFKEQFCKIATSYFITTKMFRRAFLESYHARFPHKNIGEDALFFVEFYRHDPACAVGIDRAFYHYTLARDSSLSNSYHAERLEDNFYLSRAIADTVAAWKLTNSAPHMRAVKYAVLRDLQLGIKNLSLSPLSMAEQRTWLKNAMKDDLVRTSVKDTPLSMCRSRNDKIKLFLLKWRRYGIVVLLSGLNRKK